MTTGRITHIQKYALEDGPGIRTTVFLKGCPLECAWCHNPENIRREPEMVILESRCIRCGECLAVCLRNGDAAATMGTPGPDARAIAVPADCDCCGACVVACPTGARTLLGREYTRQELLGEILRDRAFYEESGGGLTLSGGEPLAQFSFVRDLLAAAKAEGVHTALDTCGFAPERQVAELLPFVDLFLYDLKLLDEERHRRFTGVSNAIILDNLRRLDAQGAVLWLRVPVIPGVNDEPGELEAIAELAATLPAIRQINLLPYHRTAMGKFRRLNRPYPMGSAAVPSAGFMTRAAHCFASRGMPVRIGG
jgi:pyruvate formate lyase activating enzyme